MFLHQFPFYSNIGDDQYVDVAEPTSRRATIHITVESANDGNPYNFKFGVYCNGYPLKFASDEVSPLSIRSFVQNYPSGCVPYVEHIINAFLGMNRINYPVDVCLELIGGKAHHGPLMFYNVTRGNREKQTEFWASDNARTVDFWFSQYVDAPVAVAFDGEFRIIKRGNVEEGFRLYQVSYDGKSKEIV